MGRARAPVYDGATRPAGSARILSLLLAVASGCAHAPPPPVPAVVLGDVATSDLARAVRDADAARPVQLHLVEPPSSVPVPDADPAVARLIEAHRALVAADAPRCLEQLAGQELVVGALAAGRRGTAARIHLERIACHVALGEADAARVEARAMAAAALDLPSGGSSPEAEAIVADAAAELAALAPLRLDVRADVRASVSLDGGEVVCATPCTLHVRPGAHVLRLEAEGRVPSVTALGVTTDGSAVSAKLERASPQLAASQWAARYAARSDVDGAASVALLSSALRARTLVALSARGAPAGTTVRGVLVREGALAFRAEREIARGGPLGPAVDDVVRELVVEGGVVQERGVLESPWFWAAVGTAAVAASVVTYAILTPPETRVEARFR